MDHSNASEGLTRVHVTGGARQILPAVADTAVWQPAKVEVQS